MIGWLWAAALPDIGRQFPDSDPQYAGADSRELLRIQMVDLQSPPKQFSADAYFLLGKRGSFEYYAQVSSPREEEYAVTKEEVLTLFQLL